MLHSSRRRASRARHSGEWFEEAHVDAIQLLTDEHEQVRTMLTELGKTTERDGRQRRQVFDRLKDALTSHEVIEEEIFYPALRSHPRAKDLVLESYVEHDVVDRLMGELDATKPDDEMWGAKCQVMTENLQHHLEEEESELFKKARQAFDEDELERLGRDMQRRKTEAQRDLGAAREELDSGATEPGGSGSSRG
jgi:hemerythrin-like domain-containing protein